MVRNFYRFLRDDCSRFPYKQQTKTEAAIRLVEKWMADESGYDEEAWPIVKKAIEENRLSARKRFNEKEEEADDG